MFHMTPCDDIQLFAYFDEVHEVENSVGSAEYQQEGSCYMELPHLSTSSNFFFSELFRWTCYKMQ